MKDQYAWVPWFRQLAEKIAEGGEDYLIEKAKQVNWMKESPALLNYKDKNIDPFSFLYFLAQCSTTRKDQPLSESRLYRVYKSASEVFDLDDTQLLSDESMTHGCIFPAPQPRVMALFHANGVGNQKLLWEVFRRTVTRKEEITSKEFKDILDITNVAVTKLTECLFLIDPKSFMPISSTTLEFHNGLGLPSFEDAQADIDGPNGWKTYKNLLPKFRSALPGCELYEINTALYKMKLWKNKKDTTLRSRDTTLCKNFFHVSTNVHDTGDDHWKTFSTENIAYTATKANSTPYDSDDTTKKPYPLTDPSTGDIIFVRRGQQLGHAIGIVYFNEYADKGLTEENALHVLWLNKKDSNLAGYTEQRAFAFVNMDSETYRAFHDTKIYRPTFKLIDVIRKELDDTSDSQPDHKPDPEIENGTSGTAEHPLNQILYGPPGTGKTHHTVNHALAIIDSKPMVSHRGDADKIRFDKLQKEEQIAMITFHQSFTYEDFVEGIRPILNEDEVGNLDYRIVDGVFKKISKQAKDNSNKKHVLIIDEINRGNIAKIFGELITLIEPTKRLKNRDQVSVTLPYSGKKFGIPNNLYIIGTMNTADRSIALLDTALRRRFDFIVMMPDLTLVSENVAGIDCRQLLKAMNQRITALLDHDHQLGHSYFMDIIDMDTIANAFQNRIIPLLQEYFYDDWQKIRLVLNRNAFMTKRDLKTDLPHSTDLIDTERKIYDLIDKQHDAWKDPANYVAIYLSNLSKQPSENDE